jgi:hypothetical protein
MTNNYHRLNRIPCLSLLYIQFISYPTKEKSNHRHAATHSVIRSPYWRSLFQAEGPDEKAYKDWLSHSGGFISYVQKTGRRIIATIHELTTYRIIDSLYTKLTKLWT